MFQVVVRCGKVMPLADYVLTIALGGAFALGLMFIVMRREAQVNLQSGMSAEGLLQQHSGMGFGKAKKNLDQFAQLRAGYSVFDQAYKMRGGAREDLEQQMRETLGLNKKP